MFCKDSVNVGTGQDCAKDSSQAGTYKSLCEVLEFFVRARL